MFYTFAALPDTQKQTTITLKPEKENKPKSPFCHAQTQPHYFSYIFVFQYTAFIATAVLCWKHYKHSVSEEHSFSKTQLVKPTFFAHFKKTPFSKKGVIFGFGQCPLTPLFL